MNHKDAEEYTAVLEMVKDIKCSNDSIGRAIGIRLDTEISKRVREQRDDMMSKIDKIAVFIAGKERNYVDPATARRMATLKQHFRIQRDRRCTLISSVKDQEEAEGTTSEAETICESIKGKGSNTVSPKKAMNMPETNTPQKSQIAKEQKDSECTFPPDELIDLNEALVNKPELLQPQPKQWRIISFLQSKRKKIMYFLLFNLIKLTIFLIFFT